MKNILPTGKSKKAAGLLIASALLAGTIGSAVFASQNLDAVKKDIVMSEKSTIPSGESNINLDDVNLNDANLNDVNQASLSQGKTREQEEGRITADKAVEIAKNSLKTMFNTDITKYDLEVITKYMEDPLELQSMNCKSPAWNVSWVSPELARIQKHDRDSDSLDKKENPEEASKAESKEESKERDKSFVYSLTTIDAKSGEIITISCQNEFSVQSPETVTVDGAKDIAVEFIEKNNLTKGSKVANAVPYDLWQKKAVIVKIEMENGDNAVVMVNTVLGKAVYYWDDMRAENLDSIAKAAQKKKRAD